MSIQKFLADSNNLEQKMLSMRNDDEARHLMSFFKCGKGEYGEGDRFLGIRVPRTRALVKEYRDRYSLDDCFRLINSPWHEIRLAGFLIMIELYNRAKKKRPDEAKRIVDAYVAAIDKGNNWDLVDLVAPKILGDRLVEHPEKRDILYKLADMDDKLWHQRAAIVSTFALIKHGEFDDTFLLAQKFLNHRHDLMHKATGWMLREAGKRGGKPRLCEFLETHASVMPRTMLRYAIEHFSEDERIYYMSLKDKSGI